MMGRKSHRPMYPQANNRKDVMDDTAFRAPILNEELEENLVDDPYGTAIYTIRNVLLRALDHHGSMNDTELRNLLLIIDRMIDFQ